VEYLPQRKSPRHPLHDYSQGGMYHITINTGHGVPLLGKLAGEAIELSGIGRMVKQELADLPAAFNGLEIDCFEIMPDHVHILLLINGLEPQRPSLTRVMQRFKSISGIEYVKWRNVKALTHLPEKLWKRSYRDTYIKNEQQLENVRQYIRNNARQLALTKNQPITK
jgi:REP element-mobilizing transposase RayT